MTAVLGYSTIMDVINEYTSLDANGVYVKAAEVLNRKCPLLSVLPLVKANQIMSNIGSRDTYIGSPGTRSFNKGVVPTAVHSAPFSEPIAMFEDYSEVDYALYKIQNQPDQWRFNQDRRKIEGLTQKLETTLFYGNLTTIDVNGINGLTTRFNKLQVNPNGDTTWPYNVLGASGTGSDLCSIWLVEFGPGKVFSPYPPNMPAGLNIENLGKVTKEAGYAESTAGSLYEVLRTHFQWFVGLEVDDERCVQRLCNIESTGSSNIFDPDDLVTLKNQLPSMGEDPGTVILCNRTIKSQIDLEALNRSNGYFTQDASGDIFGRPVTRFQGIPILVADQLLITETQVTT